MKKLPLFLGLALLSSVLIAQSPPQMPVLPPQPKDLAEVKTRIVRLDELTRGQSETIALLARQCDWLRSELQKTQTAQTNTLESLKRDIETLKARANP